MTTRMAPAPQWAQENFGTADFGDKRLTQRLVSVAEDLAQRPSGTLPAALLDGADLQGAYRFMNNPKVSFQQIQRPHWELCRAQCQQPGEHLIIEDTTLLDYTGHPAEEEMGVLGDGNGRGFSLHSSLALGVEGWSDQERPRTRVIGLVGQQCLSPTPAPEGETRSQRYWRARYSERWLVEAIALGKPPQGCRWIFIADREADFYEPVRQCQDQGWDFIIRSLHDRRLAGQSTHLRAALAQAPVLGEMRLPLRARPGQAARIARLAGRSLTLSLAGPYRAGGKQPDFTLNAVEVFEVDRPPGVKPLHWILLTSLDCTTWAEVQRVVGRYCARWIVEEYHKAIKTGTRVEESQLGNAWKLENLVAVLALVAVRLVGVKFLAHTQPEQGVQPGEFEPESLAILEAKYGKPPGGGLMPRCSSALRV